MLVMGGLVNLYLKSNISEVFWLGFIVILFLLITAFKVMSKIEIHINELGELWYGVICIDYSYSIILCFTFIWKL